MIDEALLKQVLDGLLENMPRKSSDRYFVGDTDDIATGTSLTVTFTLNNLWVTRLIKAYADSRTGCTYAWRINDTDFDLNEVEFYKGKPVTSATITLIVANTSGSTQTVGYYIFGFGDLKSGG